MSKETAGSKPPPKRPKRKESSQTVSIGKKKPTELAAKVSAVSETGPECASLQEGNKVRQCSSLTKWLPILIVARSPGCFFTIHIY